MKYKRINELGLKVEPLIRDSTLGKYVCHFVSAEDLEALLEKGVEVQSLKAHLHWFPKGYGTTDDSVMGFVINIQPIEKPNPISIKELISDLKILQIDGLAERIQKWGIEQSGVSDE